jgi:hypothetical protein
VISMSHHINLRLVRSPSVQPPDSDGTMTISYGSFPEKTKDIISKFFWTN